MVTILLLLVYPTSPAIRQNADFMQKYMDFTQKPNFRKEKSFFAVPSFFLRSTFVDSLVI